MSATLDIREQKREPRRGWVEAGVPSDLWERKPLCVTASICDMSTGALHREGPVGDITPKLHRVQLQNSGSTCHMG